MTRKTGAQIPIASYVGRRPIAVEAPPMSRIVTTSTTLRPTLSPSRPKNSPPNGRARKPTP